GVTRDLDVFASSNPRPLAGGEFRLNLSYPRADFSVTAQPDDGYHIAYNLYHSVGNLSGYIGGGGGLDRLEDDHAAHLIRPFVSGARWALKQVVECLPH
ncbi:MAG TPA: hypothetical protein VFI84_04215, partial [Candidatus Saccharimonadales bacterium]|nr:hypothetical protein [Candidatus Saccharimonadales bacterium]